MAMTGQNKALVLLLDDNGLQLLVQEQGTLSWQQTFVSTPDGLEAFDAALVSFTGYPVILVTDLIEESFRHDSVVHVGGSDRTALLKRKLDYVFRNTTYRMAKVTDRETTGRRDDKLLMSAIIKPDLLDIWVGILVARKFAIQSITSIAHLLHAYTKLARLDQEEYLLIINVEQGNNLRQTYIRKGMVLFSRLTPMATRDNLALGNDIHQETLQLRQYLERIQFVPYEAILRIRVYSVHDDGFLQLESRVSEYNRFEVINVLPLLAAMPVELREQEAGPAYYFIGKILAGQRPENIYAPPPATRYQDLHTLSRTLIYITAGIVVLALGLNVPPLMNLLDQRQQRDNFLAQANPLQSLYERLSRNFPETPIPSREMQLLVETHEIIEQQIHSPVELLTLVSQSLAMSPGLKLTSIAWELVARPASDTDAGEDEGARGSGARERQAATEASNSLIGLILRNNTALKVRIDGEAYSPDSFRDAQNQVMAFVDALSTNPGVSVFASRLPTDVRTDISVSTTVDDREVRAPFTLELTLVETTTP